MMQGLLESLYRIYSDWRAPMTDETEAARRRPPPPPPRPNGHGTQMSPQHGTQMSPQHVTHVSPQQGAQMSHQHGVQMSPQHGALMNPQHGAHTSPKHSAQLAIQPVRPPEPRPRTQPPPRLIRPSEHLAIVERSRERRAPPLTPTVAVLHGPRPSVPVSQTPSSHHTALVPHVPSPIHGLLSHYTHPTPYVPPPPPALRPRAPPPMRMPAPVPPPVMRLPQPRRDAQVSDK
ncbi:unnamed protein product [Parnassius mnemosyne]|uniref:Uncharacterized protein n=1 Tax=Parnassius mnemosyne TaxID=213953 RepID=A0AAV1KI96_9NEOP